MVIRRHPGISIDRDFSFFFFVFFWLNKRLVKEYVKKESYLVSKIVVLHKHPFIFFWHLQRKGYTCISRFVYRPILYNFVGRKDLSSSTWQKKVTFLVSVFVCLLVRIVDPIFDETQIVLNKQGGRPCVLPDVEGQRERHSISVHWLKTGHPTPIFTKSGQDLDLIFLKGPVKGYKDRANLIFFFFLLVTQEPLVHNLYCHVSYCLWTQDDKSPPGGPCVR